MEGFSTSAKLQVLVFAFYTELAVEKFLNSSAIS